MKLPCGCCEDNTGLTPIPISNRPGQTSLKYRVGTHAAFLESMIARLSSSSYPELAGLTTRDSGDFSIAILDAWATVADVLTFYQERIANEGYLRTATERRSVLELSRLIGYTPRPGVASSVYLAYELDKGYKTEIPAGERAQSLPAPGELPQSFETSEPLSARAEWNAIKPRITRPQNIKSDDLKAEVGKVRRIYLKGTATNLKPNDKILFVFDDNKMNVLLDVNEVNVQPTNNRTEVIFDRATGTSSSPKKIKSFELNGASGSSQSTIITKKEVVKQLLLSYNLQPAGSRYLNRKEEEILKANSDFVPQALLSFIPRISDTLYTAYSSVNLVEKSKAELKQVYVLRLKTALFGYNALTPKGPTAKFEISPDPIKGVYTTTELTFKDTSDGAPTKWEWDFTSDGNIESTDQHPKHNFGTDGTYTVSLRVENAGGTSTATWTITVQITVQQPSGPK